MKVSLIVASGVHQGRSIPIAGAQFLIGRDPQCQLRPASQAISKMHCGFFVREGKVLVLDYGSTNGTSINDEALAANVEREVKHGDRVKAGPLDFTMSIVLAKPSDSTPLPEDLKNMSPTAVQKLQQSATGSQSGVAKVPPPKPAKRESEDDIAAMLLGMGDEDVPGGATIIADGSTIMEMPSPLGAPPAEEKKDEKKSAVPSKEDSSNAASDLLRKYMRRPR